MDFEDLIKIMDGRGLVSHIDYSRGAAVRPEPPKKTDAEKIEEAPINIDPLGVRDFKTIERIRKNYDFKY